MNSKTSTQNTGEATQNIAVPKTEEDKKEMRKMSKENPIEWLRPHGPCRECVHFRDVHVCGRPDVGVCDVIRWYPYKPENAIPVNADDNRYCKGFVPRKGSIVLR